jgi:hypothetical protein
VTRADLTSTANHTKWEELRLAMYGLPTAPKFRCKDLSGYYSEPDSEWFYHFRCDGYETMHFVDILVESPGQRRLVMSELQRIGLAGHAIADGFRVYGYAEPGQALDQFREEQ